MPRAQLSPKKKAFARQLRREMTDAERLLWGRLRDHRLNGLGFRRQVPMGAYVADFVCHEARLVVELDGGQHSQHGRLDRDARRSAWFASEGYLVARFWNHEVLTGLDAVLDTVLARATERLARGGPPTLPSPTRGEGSRRGRGGHVLRSQSGEAPVEPHPASASRPAGAPR